jgi:5-(hydroxymethyl)furfural/furfural oxidase
MDERPDNRTDIDVLVVGAGSAGCVVASQLASSGASVLLVEAGDDIAPDAVPADVLDLYPRSYYNSAYMWPGITASYIDQSPPSSYPQARMMGGGSNLMGMVALRGVAGDYNGWAAGGASDWSWEDVLPHFRLIETDRDFGGELHGSDGPVTIRRHLPEDWPPFCAAVGEAAQRMGWRTVLDLNADFGDGYGPLPMSSTQSGRVSAASAYLDSDSRRQPNLEILCRTRVDRLLFDGRRCVGVEAQSAGQRINLRAAKVVVCAGAILSPSLLLRSGIGSAAQLAALGVPPVIDLPGVGANLQNHPIVYLAAHIPPAARQSPSLRPGFNSSLRFSSGTGEPGDLSLLVLNKSSWHGLGASVAGLGLCLQQPLARGRVSLRDPDPTVAPNVEFGMLGHESDRARMSYGFGIACELMLDDAVRARRNEVFAAGYSRVVRALNRPGRLTALTTRAMAATLDGPDVIRRNILRWAIASGDVRESRLTDVQWQSSTVDHRSFGTFHAAGSCRMGAADDSTSVVDPNCNVLGVDGLSVVDASIMPTIPRGNINLPVMMLAHRYAKLHIALAARA